METCRRIASGANARYFRSLLQLLLSLQRAQQHRQCQVIVFDLGLQRAQRLELERRFAWAELRDYSPDPGLPHLRDIANYGWKPTVIGELLAQDSRPLLWLDSACVVTGSLEPVWRHAAGHGVWCPYGGSGGLGRWSDERVLARLGVGPEHHPVRMRAGGVCAFDLRVPVAGLVAQTWQRWAADPDLLCPPGCRPDQHNYDQTLLTVLLLQNGVNPSDDELDISSTRPAPFLRSRNKVPNWVPLWLDPAARLWFWAYREVDVFLLRQRSRRRSVPANGQS